MPPELLEYQIQPYSKVSGLMESLLSIYKNKESIYKIDIWIGDEFFNRPGVCNIYFRKIHCNEQKAGKNPVLQDLAIVKTSIRMA